MSSFERRTDPARAVQDECSNCNRSEGHERGLVCDDDRSINIVLCDHCLDSYLEEEWIHGASD
ncbi:hypothetical protein [Haloarchaeobius sp. DYHT-AS-18]|uniref:hypothetical protein n=1 Tax=Haloarchaeobius sp. DYHT-AS-18 TaxID=3446117 RepID=UPI003EB9E9F3